MDFTAFFQKKIRCARINLVMLWNIFAVFGSRPPFLEAGPAPVDMQLQEVENRLLIDMELNCK